MPLPQDGEARTEGKENEKKKFENISGREEKKEKMNGLEIDENWT